MTERRKLSGFGFLLEQLGIPTITIAKRLHVDPSLVSKWKSGDRRISKKSIFFDEIVEFLIEENDRQGGYILKDPLKKQYPLEDFEDPGKFRYFLQNMIADKNFSTSSNDFIGNKAVREVKAFLYEKGEGRRQAISNLLDMAEAQSDPGNIIYIDCEQYRWLLEDEEYTERWKERMLNLLRRGFKAKFIIHFMLHKDEVLRFFELCSPLIFHRNAEWFYHEFYDENVYWFSFFILEHAASVMGMSMDPQQSSTTVFTDPHSIMQHKNVVEMVMKSCKNMFVDIEPKDTLKLLGVVRPQPGRNETIYVYLPAPAFAFTDPEIIKVILLENNVIDEKIRYCMKANKLLTALMNDYLSRCDGETEIKVLFQLDEMYRKMFVGPFISCSLSLLAGRDIIVSRKQIARGIRCDVERMRKFPNLKIGLTLKENNIIDTNMNLWCKKNNWLVQMDEEGMRFCDENTIVNATSTVLEMMWRKNPFAYKKKEDVEAFLLKWAEDLEKSPYDSPIIPENLQA